MHGGLLCAQRIQYLWAKKVAVACHGFFRRISVFCRVYQRYVYFIWLVPVLSVEAVCAAVMAAAATCWVSLVL